jgi:nucleotide-binding universal stress UspA family protein
MFTRLLVAFDLSPESVKALDAAIDMAIACHAGLHVVTVSEDLPPYMMITSPEAPFNPEIIDDLRAQRDNYYESVREKAVERAREKGIEAHAVVVHGSESQAIIRHVCDIRADLLVIGLHKHPAVVDHLWGSTSQKIAWGCPCSILAVQ